MNNEKENLGCSVIVLSLFIFGLTLAVISIYGRLDKIEAAIKLLQGG